MSKIKQLFEQEILKKIQASNELDKKLEASRLGFNKGISYLENLCEELQTHIPTLGCQLKINDRSKSSGHFIFDANNCRIPIQLWGEYDESGQTRMGFSIGQEFTLFYKNVYWRGKEDFEQLLINDIVNKLNLIQIQ